MLNRRLFLFSAPAIIAAPSLMRVSAVALRNEKHLWSYVTHQGIVEYGNYTYAMSHGGGLILATEHEIKQYFGFNARVEYRRVKRA